MKRISAVCILFFLFLTGCAKSQDRIDRCMELRSQLLRSSCRFAVEITADYGDQLHTFTLQCTGNPEGDLTFAVVQPQSIAGITGNITGKGGFLTFDDVALHFDLLADDTVTPVSAPWILLRTLQGGYLTSAGEEDGLLRVTIDDSYEEDALQLDVWLDGQNIPVRGEILYDGRRILSLTVTDFIIE